MVFEIKVKYCLNVALPQQFPLKVSFSLRGTRMDFLELCGSAVGCFTIFLSFVWFVSVQLFLVRIEMAKLSFYFFD